VDWNLMKERYGSLVPYCAHREDLNYLLGELIAELNCSHTYVGGGDQPEIQRVGVGLLGADISADPAGKRYRIERILMGEDWDQRRISPLAQPGLKVKAGQYILAVNGRELNWPENFYSFFEDTVGKQVRLTVNDKPSMEGAWEVIVKPVGDEQQLRYLDQVEANRRKVAEATGGKVGYIHVPSTGVDGLNEFYRGYLSQFDREGLIVDVRYNNGGMIPDRFIEVLRRPLMSYWATQRSESMTTPVRPTPPYLACIINSYAGSGGDAFPYYFKFFKLGPLVGTRTWGGLVGISRNLPFVDGGGVTMPDFGTYSVDGKWVVENHGVDPDVPVENAPDQVVAGRDPQLEKAIELVMAQIKAKPVTAPPKPVYPVRN
jgi:tricorn protease